MKNIFLKIQEKLAENPTLRYIDKDWGQLQQEYPSVQFPCALLDIGNVNYSQLGMIAQIAEGNITITLANYRDENSSYRSPTKEDSYKIIELIDEVHQLLHGWCDNQSFNRLIRTNLQKIEASSNYEIYQISYKTTWQVSKQDDGTTTPVQVTQIRINP